MELNLQFGHGMIDLACDLTKKWGGALSILSPRDLRPAQIVETAKKLRKQGGVVVVDPQIYLPRSNHGKLTSHDYWPDDYQTQFFFDKKYLENLMSKLNGLNIEVASAAFILPSLLAAEVSDQWVKVQRAIIEASLSIASDKPRFMTLAFGRDALRDNSVMQYLIEEAGSWQVDGFYIVCEPPNGAYLTDDGNWLANILDLIAGLRLSGKRVVLGYANHQLLIAQCAGANAIASGSFMNVRTFTPGKFNENEGDIKRKSVWYYAPDCLCEYKLPALDNAQRFGLLDRLESPRAITHVYADAIFSSRQPSLAGFGEANAFRHYLHSMREQAAIIPTDSFESAIACHRAMLDLAETNMASLKSKAITGEARDFAAGVAASKQALMALEASRGSVLARRWKALQS